MTRRNWGVIFAYVLIVLTGFGAIRYARLQADRTEHALCSAIVAVTTPIPLTPGADAAAQARIHVRNDQLSAERAKLLRELGKTEKC